MLDDVTVGALVDTIRKRLEILREQAELDIDEYHELVVLQDEFNLWAKRVVR